MKIWCFEYTKNNNKIKTTNFTKKKKKPSSNISLHQSQSQSTSKSTLCYHHSHTQQHLFISREWNTSCWLYMHTGSQKSTHTGMLHQQLSRVKKLDSDSDNTNVKMSRNNSSNMKSGQLKLLLIRYSSINEMTCTFITGTLYTPTSVKRHTNRSNGRTCPCYCGRNAVTNESSHETRHLIL